MNRKWLFLWIAALLLVGCQREASPGPSQVFNDFMTSFKNGDMTTLSSYLDEELTDSFSYNDLRKWLDEDDMEQLRDDIQTILRDTNYSIIESQQAIPRATLKVRIETKHYGKLAEEIYTALVINYLVDNDRDVLEEAVDEIEGRLERFNTPYQKEIDVYMVYDNGWKLDVSRNEELFDALSGESYSKIKSFLP